MELLGAEPRNLSDLDLLRFQLNKKSPEVIFRDGRFPTLPNAFVPILKIRLSEETIHVAVSGVTDVAEVLVAEIFQLLWRASGVSRQWDSSDVQEGVRLKEFSTTTEVALGFDPLGLAAPALVRELQKNFSEGKKFGPLMMSQSTHDRFSPRQSVLASLMFDELHFRISLYDTRIGRHEIRYLRIRVLQRDDYGRGVVSVSSDLPFDPHADLVNMMIEALGHDKQDSKSRSSEKRESST